MPILYATKDNLIKKTDSEDIFFMDVLEWFDKEHHICLLDYRKVNTLDYLNLVDKKETIISIIVINEKTVDLNQITKLKNVQHLKLESIENIIFCDLNPSLCHLEVNYCALNYLPIVPNGLIIMDVSMNLISSTEEVILPESLKILNLNDNRFKEIPNLPNNLEILYICSNYIKTIKNLPEKLTHLFIRNNYLDDNELEKINNIYIDINKTVNLKKSVNLSI